jgi:hypothetical protein
MENKPITFDTPEKLSAKWNEIITCEAKEFDFLRDQMPKVKSNHKAILAMQLEQLEKLVLESTVSGDVAQFQPILIPMLRRIVPSLIGMEIFGVQPLNNATGLIFAMRAVYSGTEAAPQKYATSQIVVLADATAFDVGDSISNTGDAVVGEVVFKEGNKLLVKITSGDGSGRFAAGDEVDNAASFVAAETTVSTQTGNEALYKHIFSTWTGSVTTAAGEVLGTNMKEIGVTIERTTATAKSRKMKSSYTREMAEDLQSSHGIDAVSLFTQIGSEEIIMELNREFIDYADAKAVLGGTSTWNYSTADGRWEVEKYQNLAAKISRTSREIAKANRRGQGNFMIVDTSTLTALEMSGRLDTANVDPLSSAFVGMFNGYIKTFVDIQQDDTQIVMGYKGNNETDAGVFYSPYVPLKITQGVTQESDQPRIFFRMRYALTDNPFGAANYFKKIEISNLPG